LQDDRDRYRAPWARRVAKSVGSKEFLHTMPRLDAQYLGDQGELGDRSKEIEDIVSVIADKSMIKRRLRKAQHTLAWSPVAFLKAGMPLTGAARTSVVDEATPDAVDAAGSMMEQKFEPVSDEMAEALALSKRSDIPELDGSTAKQAKEPILPLPSSSLDIPWIDWVDPRHVVTERGILETNMMRYVGQLYVTTFSKFKTSSKYKNRDKVEAFYMQSYNPDNKDIMSPKSYLGGALYGTFNIPSSQRVVVLCEVWIREDPDNAGVTNRVGVLDIMSGTWVSGPRPNKLGVFPWGVIAASDETPGIWTNPSYIEQAYDDIDEAAWSRRKLKQHVSNYANYKDMIPEDLDFDDEEWEKYTDEDYNGPVRYRGNRPPQKREVPQLPVSVVQWHNFIEQNFKTNTGITGTQQGHGQSNKVATAFRQEERYANERRNEMRFKMFELYRDMMMISTFLLQRYLVEPFKVKSGDAIFEFSQDTVRGVTNYKFDVIDIEVDDPMQSRILEMQTIERIMANPEIAKHFDKREIARMVARINNWGNRTLRPIEEINQEEQQLQAAIAAQQGGGQTNLGDRVDSTDADRSLQGGTAQNAAGATNRRPGAAQLGGLLGGR